MAEELNAIVQRMIEAGESEDNIGTVIKHFKSQTPPPAAAPRPAETQSSVGALPIAAAGAVTPKVAGWALELATNPDAWKTGATIGRVVGGLSGGAGAVAAGLASGHPMTILGAPAAAAMGSWVGGKEGWRTMNLAQKLAGKSVPLLEAIGPALARAGLVQGGLDLAQMAEPTRQDIGFLGLGGGTPDPQNPAMLNAAAQWLKDQVARALAKAK